MSKAEHTLAEDGRMVKWRAEGFRPWEKAEINVIDQTVMYGLGLFEGINFYKGGVLYLDQHLDRLCVGLEQGGLEMPISREHLREKILEAVKKSGLDKGYIRPVVTAGTGKDGTLGIGVMREDPCVFIYVCRPIALYSEETYAKGIKLAGSPYRKPGGKVLDLTNIKWTDYFLNIKVKEDAKKRGYDDWIMLMDQDLGTVTLLGKKGAKYKVYDEYLSELSAANLFFIKDGVLYTPSLESNCLNGVTRNAFLKIAGAKGMQTVEKRCTMKELLDADEAFATGTAAGLIAISEVNGTKIGGGREGEKTRMLRRAYEEEVIPGNLTPVPELKGFGELKEGVDFLDLGARYRLD